MIMRKLFAKKFQDLQEQNLKLTEKNKEVISDAKELFSEYTENLKISESFQSIMFDIEQGCKDVSQKNQTLLNQLVKNLIIFEINLLGKRKKNQPYQRRIDEICRVQ